MIYLLLFLEFLKIGLFTFGGGYGMIPLIRETVVARIGSLKSEVAIDEDEDEEATE